jgi:hypothetical protein
MTSTVKRNGSKLSFMTIKESWPSMMRTWTKRNRVSPLPFSRSSSRRSSFSSTQARINEVERKEKEADYCSDKLRMKLDEE